MRTYDPSSRYKISFKFFVTVVDRYLEKNDTSRHNKLKRPKKAQHELKVRERSDHEDLKKGLTANHPVGPTKQTNGDTGSKATSTNRDNSRIKNVSLTSISNADCEPDSTVLTWSLPVQVVRDLMPLGGGKRLRPGWSEIMYDEFHNKWDTCAIVFKTNYIRTKKSTGRKTWTGYGRCRVEGCIAVKLSSDMDFSKEYVTIQCTINGKCTHDTDGIREYRSTAKLLKREATLGLILKCIIKYVGVVKLTCTYKIIM